MKRAERPVKLGRVLSRHQRGAGAVWRAGLLGLVAAVLAALPAPAAAAPPTASILVSPAAPVAGSPVTLTADAIDGDGTVVGYFWEIDDDGEFDDGATREITHTFDRAGTYPIYLGVVDNDEEVYLVYQFITVPSPRRRPLRPRPRPLPPPRRARRRCSTRSRSSAWRARSPAPAPG